MELDLFFSNSKWDILSELAKEPRSPMQLAKVFDTSIANISQQLRLMEAMNLVAKTKIQNKEKGKPRMQYSIKNELIYLVRLGKNFAKKEFLEPEPFNTFTFNVLATQSKKDQFYLMKFFWENSEVLANASIGLFKNNDETIELFVVTEELGKARSMLSNHNIKNPFRQLKKDSVLVPQQ